MCYTKIRKDQNKLSTIGLISYSQSDHILDENYLQLVVKCHNLIFYVTENVENVHGINSFFLHWYPISYFIIHVCNQKNDKHSEMTES